MKVLYEDMQAQKAVMQVQQAVNSISVELSGEVLAAAATTEALVCYHEFVLQGTFIDIS
jgi:hypothetical protein